MLANDVFSGQTLTIKAKGTLKEEVTKGAIVLLEVKYGLITLIKQTVDLCDQIQNVDLTCPLKKGDLTLTKQVELPKEIPPVSEAEALYLGIWGDPYMLMLCSLIVIRANTMSMPMCTMPTKSKSPASRRTTLNSSLGDSKLHPVSCVHHLR